MSVRAKFVCNSITRTLHATYKDGKSITQEMQTVKLTPAWGNSEENKAFFASTPTGSIELGTVNLDAAKQFELNKEYYIDFTPAPSV